MFDTHICVDKEQMNGQPKTKAISYQVEYGVIGRPPSHRIIERLVTITLKDLSNKLIRLNLRQQCGAVWTKKTKSSQVHHELCS